MIKRWLPWLLKGGVSFGLIAWVLSKVDPAAAWQQAKTIDGGMLALSVLLMTLQIGLGAVRWALVLRALSRRSTGSRRWRFTISAASSRSCCPGRWAATPCACGSPAATG